MKLVQKRIINTNRLLSDIEKKVGFVLGINIDEYGLDKIKDKLMLDRLDHDSLIFPNPEIGIMCKRNFLGEYISLKHLDKVVDFRTLYYEIKDWGGNLHSGYAYVPYERYQREWIKPKEYKLKFIKRE